MAGNYPPSDTWAIQLPCREVVNLLGSTSTGKPNSLCAKFVIFLFFQQAQMFSKARLEDKREKKRKCLVPPANTCPNQHDTSQEQESLECSVNPCPWSQLATLFPSLPHWALPKDERYYTDAREVISTAIVGFLAY